MAGRTILNVMMRVVMFILLAGLPVVRIHPDREP
jgi:hypothetical protein